MTVPAVGHIFEGIAFNARATTRLGDATKLPPQRLEPKPRFYYGWVIVGVIFLTGVASAAWMNASLSVFLKPITSEFGWNRSTFTAAGTIGTLLGGASAVFIGPSIDRYGARWVLLAGSLGTGAIFLLMGQIDGVVPFFILLIAGRFILQGILNVANTVVVSKWFILQRGRAAAIAAVGPRLGTGFIPLFAQVMTTGFEWRTAMASVGILTCALTVVPVYLWLRRRPEDLGLLPDGATAERTSGNDTQGQTLVRHETSYTIQQVLRFKGFYLLMAGFTLSQFVSTGINFNLLPYLTDQGIPAGYAATIVSVWSLVGIPSTLAAGYLAERFRIRYLLVIAFIGVGMGNLLLTMADSVAMGLAFAVVQGSFFGAVLLYQTLAFADYYGRASQGAIRGAITPVLMVANSLGPLAGTLVYDVTGSYLPIMYAYLVIAMVIVCAMFFATPPRRQP